MTHFFERRDPWGNGMALWVLLGLLFLIPPAIWSVQRVRLDNNVENWLPASDPQAQVLSWYQTNFESDDHVLISWDSSSLYDPRVGKLAARLTGVPDDHGHRRNGLPEVATVVTPNEIIERMTAQGVDRNKAVESLQGLLIGRGTMKVTLTEAGRTRQQSTVNMLLDAADKQYGIRLLTMTPAQIAAHRSIVTIEVTTDANAVAATQKDEPSASAETRTVDFELSWPGMQFDAAQVENVRTLALSLRAPEAAENSKSEPLIADCFFVPGSPVAVALTLSEAGQADVNAALEKIRLAAAEVGIRPEELHLAGHAVTATALNAEIHTAAWNKAFSITQPHRRSVILLSALVGILIAMVVLRNFQLGLFVLAVSAYTLLASVALVPATSGSMNMMLIVMPTLLWVVTISAAMHVVNYWRHAKHHNFRDAVVQATRMARRPCVWASLTTAIGLFALTSSPLAPVKEFGWYGAIGCLISLFLVLYGLPALLQFWPSSLPEVIEADGTEWKLIAESILKRRVTVIVVCLLMFSGGMYGLRWFHTESRVINYFPQDARVAEDFHFFEEKLAGIMPLEMIVRFNADAQGRLNFTERIELVREIENEVRRLPHVSGALSLADFRTQAEVLPESASFVQRARFNREASAVETALKESEDSAIKSMFVVTTRDADLPGDSTGRLCTASDELWRISAHVTTLADLDYASLTDRLDAIARKTLKRHAGAGHIVTGTVPLFVRTQQAVLQSLIKSFVITLIVIGLVMAFQLRSPVAGTLALLPSVLPIGMVFGLISWLGWSVDIGTMVTASVALGLAVDGTFHLLTWFRNGIEQGLPRREACTEALMQCGPAMWQTAAVISLGLLMLAPADLLLVSRFGLLMAASVVTSLAASVALFPILLDGPLGRLIESHFRPARVAEGVAPRPIQKVDVPPMHTSPNPPGMQPHLNVIASTGSKQGRKLRVDRQ